MELRGRSRPVRVGRIGQASGAARRRSACACSTRRVTPKPEFERETGRDARREPAARRERHREPAACGVTPDTKGIMNGETLARMKAGARSHQHLRGDLVREKKPLAMAAGARTPPRPASPSNTDEPHNPTPVCRASPRARCCCAQSERDEEETRRKVAADCRCLTFRLC